MYRCKLHAHSPVACNIYFKLHTRVQQQQRVKQRNINDGSQRHLIENMWFQSRRTPQTHKTHARSIKNATTCGSLAASGLGDMRVRVRVRRIGGIHNKTQ